MERTKRPPLKKVLVIELVGGEIVTPTGVDLTKVRGIYIGDRTYDEEKQEITTKLKKIY